MDKKTTLEFIDSKFDSWFVPSLAEFVRIPNLTPMVDSEYLYNGLLDKAMKHVDESIQKLEIKGLTKYIYKNQEGLPLVCYVVESSSPEIK